MKSDLRLRRAVGPFFLNLAPSWTVSGSSKSQSKEGAIGCFISKTISLLCKGIKGEFWNYRTDASKVTPHFDLKYFWNFWSGILLESGPIFGILSIGPKHVLIGTKPILVGSIFAFGNPNLLSEGLKLFSIGPILFLIGLKLFSVDLISFLIGLKWFPIGPILFSKGLKSFSIGPILFSVGLKLFSIGPILFSIGLKLFLIGPILFSKGLKLFSIGPILFR